MGRYVGKLVAEWLPDGRKMELQKPFAFIDSDELRWGVPKRAQVDGASIPKFLWSITGGPYEGKYRNASVVHDYFCSVNTRTWQATHRMFYEAMLVSGVAPRQATIMYAAVRYAGPRWSVIDIHNTRIATGGRGDRYIIQPERVPGEDYAGLGGDYGGGGTGGGGAGGMADFGDDEGQVFRRPEDGDMRAHAPKSEEGPAAWAPAQVSHEEFAAFAAQIEAGDVDLAAIEEMTIPQRGGRIKLPKGVFTFDANPETYGLR
jgi:hypothetical protein